MLLEKIFALNQIQNILQPHYTKIIKFAWFTFFSWLKINNHHLNKHYNDMKLIWNPITRTQSFTACFLKATTFMNQISIF